MKHLQDYKLFENRKESISIIESLEEGQVIRAKKDINFKDIDLSKIAKTWWGRNVANIDNIIKKMEGVWIENYKFKKGDVPFISQGGNLGYIAGISKEIDVDNVAKYRIDKSPSKIGDFNSSIFGLLIQEGFCEIVSYEDLSEKFRKGFEYGVKIRRINHLLKSNDKVFIIRNDVAQIKSPKAIVYEEISSKNGIMSITIIENRKKETYYFSEDKIDGIEFITDGGEITGNPFEFFL